MPRVFCFVIVGSFGEFVLDLERGVLGTGDFDFLDDFFQNEIMLLKTKKEREAKVRSTKLVSI